MVMIGVLELAFGCEACIKTRGCLLRLSWISHMAMNRCMEGDVLVAKSVFNFLFCYEECIGILLLL